MFRMINHVHGMLAGFEKPLSQLTPAKEQTNPWTLGFAPHFNGDDIGAYYTSLGRGGKVILKPIFNAIPAIDYTPQVAVQGAVYGSYITGDYSGMPLAQIANPTANQPIVSI